MNSSHSTPSKKTLRKKPPPELEVPTSTASFMPPLTPTDHSFGMESERINYTPTVEEQIINISTPRPMGPKELPDYDMGMNTSMGSALAPYPTHDPIDHFYQEDYAKVDILNQTFVTPTKIPALDIPNSLSHDYNSVSPTEYRFSMRHSSSPERYNSFNRVDDSHTRLPNPITVQDSGLAPMLSAIGINTVPKRPNVTPGTSRSPSPKKIYGRSPSLMYNFTDEYDDNQDAYYQENEYNNEPDYELNHINSYTENTYYEDDYLSDEQDSPTSKLFDYSTLPDLPSISTATNENSPTKRMTLNSAISFVKGQSYAEDNTSTPRLSSRKKHAELPPVPLDLPTLPFTSSSLVAHHFAMCKNVWSLAEVFNWCLKLRTWLHDLFILKKEFKKALIKLIVFHKRDIPLDTIGSNVDQIVASLVEANAITFDLGTMPNEEGEKSLPNPDKPNTSDKRASRSNPGVQLHEGVKISGVLVELTSCYCFERDHKDNSDILIKGTKLRCLSSRCYLNRIIDNELRFRNSDVNEVVLGDDWASHWKLTADDLKKYDKDVSKKQSLLFDLLRYEQTFIQRAKLFTETVGPEFIKAVRTLIGSEEVISISSLEEDILQPSKELLQIHRKSLFEPLLKILISNGKFIKDVSDIGSIYLNWSQVVKSSLLKYMATMPMIEELLSYPSIKQWVDIDVRNMPKVKELRINGPLLFLSTFNSRYQQLPLQLLDIMKLFEEDDSEYKSLQKAIDGIKKTSTKVNDMKHHADNIHGLKRIQKQLIWKNQIMKPNINFSSENRTFLHRGNVTRKGDLRINTSINHLILLDNYLLITDRVKSSKNLMVKYRVIEQAIPIEYLLVEVKDRETPTIELNTITKNLTLPLQPEFNSEEEDPSVYPFKVRYAGHGKSNAFVFSTRSERERNIWIDNLMKARTNLCQRLSKAEPYHVKAISNTCFAYEESNKITKLQKLARGDPIEKISSDSLGLLNKLGFKGDIYDFENSTNHIIYSMVLSATTFQHDGYKYYLVGTAGGVYCCDMIHEWKRVVLVYDTTKITVLAPINLVVMLNGNNLRYYPLDVLINYYYGRRDSISSVALSNDAVSFFEIGTHREITMLFYAKKKSGSSGATNFKVCVPETDNAGIFSSFKTVKKFYVQAECYGISIFNTSFAVQTNKGFEILELDKLLPRSVPELPSNDGGNKRIDQYTRRNIGNGSPEIEAIKKLIFSTNCKPMGMFKLNNSNEFLLAYNECAIFINKHGKLSRPAMLRFNFRAKNLSFKDNHLVLVCDEAIEAWSISDFTKGTNRLIQVAVGKDIRMINDNGAMICCMANPLVLGVQLIFELVSKNL